MSLPYIGPDCIVAEAFSVVSNIVCIVNWSVKNDLSSFIQMDAEEEAVRCARCGWVPRKKTESGRSD